jgi:predicted NBD/HSP70 family sugar kinase
VADADFVRRQNRGLVMSALRSNGPMSRTQLASITGLSNASLTAISTEMLNQGILLEGPPPAKAGQRGRPAIELTFRRDAFHVALVELDVTRARFSLANYGGILVDRVETPVTPGMFAGTAPAPFLAQWVRLLKERNPAEGETLAALAISAQGMLDRQAGALSWSPVPDFAGNPIVAPLSAEFGIPVTLQKRGVLLARGARLLYPQFGEEPIAALFLGSTVAMGVNLPGRSDSGATEFGHMNHIPDGARCRCGQRGCIEAYAADYGVLRLAYGVPDQTPPAATVPASAYQQLISSALGGNRDAGHAFRQAGRAIGFGLARLMTILPPAHVIVTGPGAAAYGLMEGEIRAALDNSLVSRVAGPPDIIVHHDEREPIYQGMLAETLAALDESVAASAGAEALASNAR